MGHVANAIYVWGFGRAHGARVLLRIEDHDRQRCRPEYDAALLEDLGWLGFEADEGPVRQSDPDAVKAYEEALQGLRADELAYACDCTRSTFASVSWTGPGCPGGCRSRGLEFREDLTLRVALGGGRETWMDLFAGPLAGDVAEHGDLAVRDRRANWTYPFAVVVDDQRQAVDLVIRGRDLLHATAAQIRLARLLGRDRPPAFLHHPLIHKPSGAKLSKAEADTSVRELRAAGASPQGLIGRAAAAVGLVGAARPLSVAALVERFATGMQGGGQPPRLAD